MGDEYFCGMDLFTDFTFEDLTKANPPKKKGVYVIKVKKRGMPPDEIISQLTTHIAGLHWEMVQAYLTSRIARINNITGCPVIYLGSAGTGHTSRHTLAGRYRDLASRHTAQYPLWALRYSGTMANFLMNHHITIGYYNRYRSVRDDSSLHFSDV
jgi:hypothetical protein